MTKTMMPDTPEQYLFSADVVDWRTGEPEERVWFVEADDWVEISSDLSAGFMWMRRKHMDPQHHHVCRSRKYGVNSKEGGFLGCWDHLIDFIAFIQHYLKGTNIHLITPEGEYLGWQEWWMKQSPVS